MSYKTFKNHCLQALSRQKMNFSGIHEREVYIRKLFIKVFKINTFSFQFLK